MKIYDRFMTRIIFESNHKDIKETIMLAIKSGANLTEADLTVANLRGADLRGANLRGADLRVADLTGADLRGADLTVANLSGANLTVADLTGANLRGATLCNTKFEHTKISYRRKIVEVNFTEIKKEKK